MRWYKEIYSFALYLRYRYWNWRDSEIRNFRSQLSILNSKETIQFIIENKCNVSRYGDGEFYVMNGESNGFQTKDQELANRLQEVIRTPKDNLLLCIPYGWINTGDFVLKSKIFLEAFLHTSCKTGVKPFLNTNIIYGDSLFTRFYITRQDKSTKRVSYYIEQLKKLWDRLDILIVEGEYTRSGVGNDLFDNANSIKRILCPSKNAFDKYDEIYNAIKNHAQNKLVLLALGMTATVLAADLLKENIWAIDLGHIDTEYSWFKMGAKEKVKIPGKIVDEVTGGSSLIEMGINEEYEKQIIEVIL